MNGSRQGEARATPKGSREEEAITRPSRAGDKRSRQPESRVSKIWPSFIRMPWDIWVDEVVDGEKGAGADIDVTVLAKHSMNVRRLGIEAAFDLAVAKGEIDGETQAWLGDRARRELTAFELFRSTGQYSSWKSAAEAWKRFSHDDKDVLAGQVDGNAMGEMFRQIEARKEGFAAAILNSKLFGEPTVIEPGELQRLVDESEGLD